MKYNRLKFAAGLFVLNIGAFLTTAVFLPEKGGIYYYKSQLEGYIVRHGDWHLAWGVLLATLTVSLAGWLIVEAFSSSGKTAVVETEPAKGEKPE